MSQRITQEREVGLANKCGDEREQGSRTNTGTEKNITPRENEMRPHCE